MLPMAVRQPNRQQYATDGDNRNMVQDRRRGDDDNNTEDKNSQRYTSNGVNGVIEETASSSSSPSPSDVIPYARWPDDAPFKFEERIISIVVGHSSLHWALHEGSNQAFFPVLFWNTPHIDMDVVTEEEETHCELLERHTAKQAHSLIFGDSDEPDIYNVSLAAAQRISPAISVYVISDDVEQDKAILYMFAKVPSRIFRLCNTDFFPREAGVFPSLSADLAASMLAARNTYGNNPTLVVDGNKAITFAAMDSSAKIIGGGVAAGMSIRLRSLADTVSGMPRIKFGDLQEVLQNAKKAGGLPTFATDTKTAVMSSACSEVATQLRNIVKRFVCITRDENDEIGDGEGFNVIITGGDGKLLYELLETNASGIITVDSSLALPPNVRIFHKKNLSRYGVGSVLEAKCNERNALYPESDLLHCVGGARVAKAFPAPDENNDFIRRGLVLYCNKKESFDDHEFCVRYDDDGSEEIWTLIDMYDGLVVYDEIGEKPTKGKDVDWVLRRKAKSALLLDAILQNSAKVRERKEELVPDFVDGKISTYFSREAEMSYGEKLRAFAAQQEEMRKEPPRKRSKREKKEPLDPSVYIGERVAKFFPIEDPNDPDKMRDEIFFGTVTKIAHRRYNWFKVIYDDGDSEEMNLIQLHTVLTLYCSFKHVDPYVRSGGLKEKAIAEDVLKDYAQEEATKVSPEASTLN